MDWTQIWEAISPYINSGAIVAVGTIVVTIIANVAKSLKSASATVAQSIIIDEQKLGKIISDGFPRKLQASIKPLVESELAKINENVRNATAEFSTRTAKKLDVIAAAIASMRTIPDEQRNQLLALIETDISVSEAVTVDYEISPEIAEMAASNTAKTPVIFTD